MPRVRVKDGDREEVREILGRVMTFGRSPDNHVILTDRECSRHHFYIEKVEYGFKMVDLESRNGTKTNGQFRNQHLLQGGDLISIGRAEIRFEDDGPPPRLPSVTPATKERTPPGGPPMAPRAVMKPAGPPSRPDVRIQAPPSRADVRTQPAPLAPSAPTAEAPARPAPGTASRRHDPLGRLRQSKQRQEQRTLTLVFVLAGVVILLLAVVFGMAFLTGGQGQDRYVRERVAAAEREEAAAAAAKGDLDLQVRHLEAALKEYSLIPQTSAEAYAKAQQKKTDLAAAIARVRGEIQKQNDRTRAPKDVQPPPDNK
jgi:hypothetical protein